MSENIQSAPNVKVAYIVRENDSNTESSTNYQPVAINVLQIPDNNVTINKNKSVQVLPKPPDEFSLPNIKSNVIYRILRPEDLDLKAPTPENVQKPLKRCKQRKFSSNNYKETDEIPKKIFRTRSGRMSKPPKHIQENTSQIIIDNIPVDEISTLNTNTKNTKESIKKIPKLIENKRIISSQYRCTTCKKAYLGQNKMLKHLQLNPGHVAPEFKKKSTSFWTQLVHKTKTVPKNQQSQLFCEEVINLIYKARSIIPKLLKHVEKDDKTNFTVDSIVSDALGIPEGQYTFDDTVSITEVLKYIDNSTSDITESENCQNNDQNSLLNLLDTGQVTFDSSTNTEEVINVDQLVNERLKTLTGGELESTNNTVQNLNLDLSLDMFSYHQ